MTDQLNGSVCATYSAHWFDPRTGRSILIDEAFCAPNGRWEISPKTAGDQMLRVKTLLGPEN